MSKITELFSNDCPVSYSGKARSVAEFCDDLGTWWTRAYQGDWLLWTAGNAGAGLNLIIAAAAECVRTSLRCLPKNEMRPKQAIELAQLWTRGKASQSECAKFADELLASCMSADLYGGGRRAAAAMAAVGAAEAVVSSAGQSHDAVLSVTLATNAARRAAIAIGRAEGDDAMHQAHVKCAEIVRSYLGVTNKNGVWIVVPLKAVF